MAFFFFFFLLFFFSGFYSSVESTAIFFFFFLSAFYSFFFLFFFLFLFFFFFLLWSLFGFQFLSLFEVVFDFLIFPLEHTVIELNVSYLQISIIKVYSFKFSFFVAEEMVDSFQTGLGVHKGDESHDDQSHRDSNKIKYGDYGVYLGGRKAFLPIHGGVDSEDDDGREDRKHIHDDFDVGTIEQSFEVPFDLLSSDFVDFGGNEVLPAVVLDDSYAREVLVDALCSLIGPIQRFFSESESFLSNFVLKYHTDGEHTWSDNPDPPNFKNEEHYGGGRSWRVH